MTYQEIEQIRDATYIQTNRLADNHDQWIRDFDGTSCRVWGDILQKMAMAERAYKAAYSEEQKAAMWEDMFNFVKGQAEYAFGYYAAKCEEHGKRKE